MFERARSHVRHNVVAYLALFVALTGTTYAAVQIPKGSVGSGSVRNHALRGVDVRNDALTGTQVSEGTLDCEAIPDCIGGGPAGPAGPQGAQGDVGPMGPPGEDGSPDTAQQVLDKLKTVDGSGSGLDADTLDGLDPSAFGGPTADFAAEASPPGLLPSTDTQVISKNLPAGDYLLLATVSILNPPSTPATRHAICVLMNPAGTDILDFGGTSADPGFSGAITLSAAKSYASADTATVVCSSPDRSGATGVSVSTVTLHAITLDSIE